MTLDSMQGITEGSYTGFCKSQLITCNFVKACNGVCPFEDALKHADKKMNEQTVIDHDRDWIIGCIEHDGFIHTDRFDKANQIIHDALSAEAETTVIRSRTLMPTKDFKEWAKRIRETNPNAVVIPCDAEVVSTDAVEVVRCKDCIHWLPQTQCGFDEDNDEYHDYCGLLIPDDDYYAYRRKTNDYCSYGERSKKDD